MPAIVLELIVTNPIELIGKIGDLEASPEGRGIVSITAIGNTATILYTDATTEDIALPSGADGNGIVSISLKETVGLVDTYTITFDDATTFDFNVTDGIDGVTPVKGVDYSDGEDGNDGASIVSAAFVADDLVFTKDDSSTVTLVNAKIDLKGEDGAGAVDSVNTQTGTVVLDADDISDTSTTNKFTNTTEKSTWNGKQDALGYTAENASNKKTSLTDSDTDYPTTKAVNSGLAGKSDTSHNHTGVYEPLKGDDDNFVTDTEKSALHAQNTDTILDNGGINQITASDIKGHTLAADIHRAINDSGTSETETWSASKVNTQLSGKEPTFSKNTGFNKNLGTTAGTVSEGNHAHSGTYEPADATILKQADVKNNLTSTDTDKPLSAAQGKALQDGKAPLASPTLTGTVTLPKVVNIKDTSADHEYQLAVSELTANRVITLPLLTAADEFVFKAFSQTLTNKTLTSAKITTGLEPTSDDGAALGTTTKRFSDLFLAEGGVINWDNGDATITQVGDVVTLAGANLVVPAIKITTGAGASKILTSDADGNASWATALSGVAFWTLLAGTPTRVGNTSFTVTGDYTALLARKVVLKWTDTTTHCAMITSSSYSNPNTTVNIIGDVLSATATMASIAMALLEAVTANFAVAGTIGAVASDVANTYFADEPYRVCGADMCLGTAGTTNSTTIDINKGGTTMFTTKPTCASTVAVGLGFTADDNVSLALSDKVSIDIDAVQTTKAVDLYVKLFLFPTKFLSLT